MKGVWARGLYGEGHAGLLDLCAHFLPRAFVGSIVVIALVTLVKMSFISQPHLFQSEILI